MRVCLDSMLLLRWWCCIYILFIYFSIISILVLQLCSLLLSVFIYENENLRWKRFTDCLTLCCCCFGRPEAKQRYLNIFIYIFMKKNFFFKIYFSISVICPKEIINFYCFVSMKNKNSAFNGNKYISYLPFNTNNNNNNRKKTIILLCENKICVKTTFSRSIKIWNSHIFRLVI